MNTKNIAQIVNGIKTETKILAISLVIILLLSGCTTPATPNNNGWSDLPSSYKIEGIPIVKQTVAGTSFSVATEMALKSLGVDVSWQELKPIIQAGNYDNIDALNEYVRGLDEEIKSDSYHFDLGDLLHLINRDVIIVAGTKYSPESISAIWRVPNGYNISKEEIYLNDPWTGGEITISFDDFEKYSYGCDDLDDWVGVLIYDKNTSIEDLNLTPFSYPCYKNYKPKED